MMDQWARTLSCSVIPRTPAFLGNSRSVVGFSSSVVSRLGNRTSSQTSQSRPGCRIGTSWEPRKRPLLGRKRRDVDYSQLFSCRAVSTDEQNAAAEEQQGEKGAQKSSSNARVFETPSGGMKPKIDPVGILKGADPLVAKPLAIFLRERFVFVSCPSCHFEKFHCY
jgi:hypothetical protein